MIFTYRDRFNSVSNKMPNNDWIDPHKIWSLGFLSLWEHSRRTQGMNNRSFPFLPSFEKRNNTRSLKKFQKAFQLKQHRYVWLGKLGLLALVIHICISVFSSRLGLTFEQWRRIHYIIPPLIISLVFVHSWETGDDLREWPVGVLWIAFLLVAFAAYTYHTILKPVLLSRHPYRVVEIKQEIHNV
jgi:predicted ferric reductase